MNIPLELVNVLNWRAILPQEHKQHTDGAARELAANHYLSVKYPVCEHLVQFGIDYHNFMDNNDPARLDEFIDKYKDDSYPRLATFAKGLKMDIDAVRNTLLYPHISNGIVEGNNSATKCVKRVGGNRANIDLLTAKMVIRQRDKNPREGLVAQT